MILDPLRSSRTILTITMAMATTAVVACSSASDATFEREGDNTNVSVSALSGPGDEPLSKEQTKQVFEEVAAAYFIDAQTYDARFVVDFRDTGTKIEIGRDRVWTIVIGTRDLEPAFTRDLATFSACHEVGHALGGFPFKADDPQRDQVRGLENGEFGTVSAAEGQADYFTGKDCLPRLWGHKRDENRTYRSRVSATTKARCDGVWTREEERDLCYRIATVINNFVVWRRWQDGSTDRQDPTVSPGIDYNYPNGKQCRVDSMFAGALCPVRNAVGDIPGLVPPYSRLVEIDPTVETDAAHASCADGPGARPLCWFKPHATPYDCSAIPHLGDCIVTDDGGSAERRCDERMGIRLNRCAPGSICRIDEIDGMPTCF